MLVGGLVGYGAYKMTQKDAQRIEQHTGVDPEELEDAELEQAMTELGIAPETVTQTDLEQSSAPAAAAPAPAPAPPAPAGAGSEDFVAQLEQLASLRDAGILTEEEFAAKKAQILGLD
jgi:Short C-terminal domain